mgnify:CR=1 FL=1
MQKTLGFILLGLGLFIIAASLVLSWQIFTGVNPAPELFSLPQTLFWPRALFLRGFLQLLSQMTSWALALSSGARWPRSEKIYDRARDSVGDNIPKPRRARTGKPARSRRGGVVAAVAAPAIPPPATRSSGR